MHGGKKPAFQYIGPNVEQIGRCFVSLSFELAVSKTISSVSLPIAEVTRDNLQTLPSTRQRHSLLTFGKNLLDIPDDPQSISAYGDAVSKKRIIPDSGFSLSSIQKMPRTLSENDIALNLSCKDAKSTDFNNFAMPSSKQDSEQMKRTNSLLDLSSVCEMERKRIEYNPRHQGGDPQRSPFQSLGQQQPSQGISLLKRALTAPGESPSMPPPPRRSSNVQILQLSATENSHAAHQQPSVMRLVGLNRSKTVIALMPHTTPGSSSAAAGTVNARPAHQQKPMTTSSQMISISRINRGSQGRNPALNSSPNEAAVSLVRTTSLWGAISNKSCVASTSLNFREDPIFIKMRNENLNYTQFSKSKVEKLETQQKSRKKISKQLIWYGELGILGTGYSYIRIRLVSKNILFCVLFL